MRQAWAWQVDCGAGNSPLTIKLSQIICIFFFVRSITNKAESVRAVSVLAKKECAGSFESLSHLRPRLSKNISGFDFSFYSHELVNIAKLLKEI